MGLFFRSILSSSSGNCLALWTEKTAILIDCGIRSQRECRRVLAELTSSIGRPAGVIVSHAHSDHICRPALKALGAEGVAVYAHKDSAPQIESRHVGPKDAPPGLHLFDGAFEVGELLIEPFPLAHAPGFATFGFVIHHRGRADRKVVVCTDFHGERGLVSRFADADFIFVEANHDPDLLMLFPNYASRFHMSNPKTGRMLCEALAKSERRPGTVMLGHLSKERNREDLAAGAIIEAMQAEGQSMSFALEVAPRYEPSKLIQIA